MPQPLPEELTRAVPKKTPAKAMPQVALVILNWNGQAVLRDCLRSVSGLSYPAVETIVVDNGSSDGSVQMVRNEFANCLLIENPVNLGFCVGNNQGARLALERGSDYILVLNNDTVLDPNCLTLLVERAESDPQIAAISPKIYFAEPADRLWFGGGTFSFWKGRCGLTGYGQRETPDINRPHEMQCATGCAMLVSSASWRAVGQFDERLFFSGEDVDWSLRAQKAGYRLFYEPRAVVWHRESYSILRNEGMAAQMYFYTRNQLLVMWRHGCWWHWLTFVPYFTLLSLKRVLAAAVRGDLRVFRSVLRGFWDFPTLVRERAEIGRDATSHL